VHNEDHSTFYEKPERRRFELRTKTTIDPENGWPSVSTRMKTRSPGCGWWQARRMVIVKWTSQYGGSRIGRCPYCLAGWLAVLVLGGADPRIQRQYQPPGQRPALNKPSGSSWSLFQ